MLQFQNCTERRKLINLNGRQLYACRIACDVIMALNFDFLQRALSGLYFIFIRMSIDILIENYCTSNGISELLAICVEICVP